jgi:hypothetical protein
MGELHLEIIVDRMMREFGVAAGVRRGIRIRPRCQLVLGGVLNSVDHQYVRGILVRFEL